MRAVPSDKFFVRILVRLHRIYYTRLPLEMVFELYRQTPTHSVSTKSFCFPLLLISKVFFFKGLHNLQKHLRVLVYKIESQDSSANVSA